MRAWAFAALVGLAAAVLPAGGAAAAPTVTQQQAGHAIGTVTYDVYDGARHEQGFYFSNGQLGNGTYEFDRPADPAIGGCGGSTEPTSARFVRSDGAVLHGAVTGDDPCGAALGVHLGVTLTSGTRELVGAHFVFTRTKVATGASVTGGGGPEELAFSGTTTATHRIGYWMLGGSGQISSFGGAFRTYPAAFAPPPVDIEGTSGGDGIWVVNARGAVVPFGNAEWHGEGNVLRYGPGEVAVSLTRTPTNLGYWVVTNRGRVEAFGDARFHGDAHTLALHAPVVGSAATSTGNGYWLVASDGGVFAFGDARFFGSMGGRPLVRPVVGVARVPNGNGYWLVASDGGVFAFHAPFLGSMGGRALNRPVVGLVAYGGGYLMVASDGGIFSFSHAPFFGSLGAAPLASPIVNAAAVG
jgi:hypothetical protein